MMYGLTLNGKSIFAPYNIISIFENSEWQKETSLQGSPSPPHAPQQQGLATELPSVPVFSQVHHHVPVSTFNLSNEATAPREEQHAKHT